MMVHRCFHGTCRFRSVMSFLVAAAFCIAGCRKGTSEKGTVEAASSGMSTNAGEAPGNQPAMKLSNAENGLQPDAAYPVPESRPEELLNFVNQLAERQPQGANQQDYANDLYSMTKSRLIATDRILADNSIDAGLREAAVVAKLDALRSMASLDPNGIGQGFEPFAETLIVGSDPRLAHIGRISRFQYLLDQFGNGVITESSKIIDEVKVILQDPRAGETEFLATQYAPVVLDQRGRQDEATEVLRMVGERFIQSDDRKLADEAASLLRKTEFRVQVINAMQGDQKAVQTLVTSVKELLASPPAGASMLELLDTTLNAGQMLEFTRNFPAAKEVFTLVHKTFSTIEDKQLAEQAKRSVEHASKRLGLIGSEIDIEGVRIDGQSFQFKSYAGKVLLIDFWTTWSPPWLDSLPNLRATYDRFHDRGFEIIGVNLDEDREVLYQFLKQNRLPWPVVVDETIGGFGNPNAHRYGVDAVPFIVLVGSDGKVDQIHIRGADLDQRIESLLQTKNAQQSSAGTITR